MQVQVQEYVGEDSKVEREAGKAARAGIPQADIHVAGRRAREDTAADIVAAHMEDSLPLVADSL